MAEKKKAEAKSSIKTYKQGIDSEKQKMAAYSRKMETNVKSLQAGIRSLQNKFKGYSKGLREAANELREQGIKNMSEKVGKFKGEIRGQIRENREAVSHMQDNVKYYLSEIHKKKKDFQAYARGPFKDYIKAFWG